MHPEISMADTSGGRFPESPPDLTARKDIFLAEQADSRAQRHRKVVRCRAVKDCSRSGARGIFINALV